MRLQVATGDNQQMLMKAAEDARCMLQLLSGNEAWMQRCQDCRSAFQLRRCTLYHNQPPTHAGCPPAPHLVLCLADSQGLPQVGIRVDGPPMVGHLLQHVQHGTGGRQAQALPVHREDLPAGLDQQQLDGRAGAHLCQLAGARALRQGPLQSSRGQCQRVGAAESQGEMQYRDVRPGPLQGRVWDVQPGVATMGCPLLANERLLPQVGTTAGRHRQQSGVAHNRAVSAQPS